MAEIDYWEKVFVERFIARNRRDRYLRLLKGKKHRPKLLDRLNHNLDFIPSVAHELPVETSSPSGLLAFLHSQYVDDTCHLIADGNEMDGKELRLEIGVEALFDNVLGAVLICPPKPISIYKEEDIGRLILLSDS